MKSISVAQVSRHRRLIYGAAALMIMFFHMGTNIPNRGALKILRILQDLGCCGVEMFLLLSGFGLMRSLQKQPGLKTFWARRLARVLPPLAVCALCFDIVLYRGPYAAQVGEGFALDYLMSSAVWYVSFIALMYLLYPLLDRLCRKRRAVLWLLTAACTLFSFLLETHIAGPRDDMIMRMVSRIPVFLLGCVLAPREIENRPVSRCALPVLMPLSAVLIAVWRKNMLPGCAYSVRMLCFTVCAMTIILLLAILGEWLSGGRARRIVYRFLGFCGAYSLEIYLVFARVRALMAMIPAGKWGAFASLKMDFAAAILTILLSALLSEACSRAVRALERKRL